MAEITINMLRDSINAVLDTNFPGVEIDGEEIKAGLQEPCFFVKLLQGAHEQELGRRYRRAHSFDIHYFGVNNRDMHSTAEKLYDVLGSISVAGSVVHGTSMSHEIVDRVLHFFVDYNFHVMRQKQAETKMQTLVQEASIKNG